MKGLKSKVTRALQTGARVETCDNSGAKMVIVITVKGHRTTKRQRAAGGVGDLIIFSVVKGRPDMRKTVVPAIIVRQKKEYRRPDGMRIKFEDNAVIIMKDDKGNIKGTIFKGPIAKEAAERWPTIAKVASIVV